MGPQNAGVYAEQAIPAGADVIIVKVNAGTDQSTKLGPGITLVRPNGEHTKFHLSPGNQRYGILHRGELRSFRGMDPASSHWLRIQFVEGNIKFDGSTDGENY